METLVEHAIPIITGLLGLLTFLVGVVGFFLKSLVDEFKKLSVEVVSMGKSLATLQGEHNARMKLKVTCS